MVTSNFKDSTFQTIEVENSEIQYKFLAKNLIRFIYKLDRSRVTIENLKTLESSLSQSVPFPIRVDFDNEHYVIFQGLVFGNIQLDLTLSNIVKTICSVCLPNTSEPLQVLGNQISEGIKSMGFTSLKSQITANKHLYLFAINDHCNNCSPEWSSIPFLFEVRKNTIIAKVVFSIKSKPAQFDRTPADHFSIFKPKTEKNLKVSEKYSGLEDYLKDSHDEFKPISSKFSKEKKDSEDLTEYPNIYIKMLNELINFSKGHIGNWKFIYDKNKSQVYMKCSMKPLYPLHLNKSIPKLLTSEAIIFFTGFGHGIYNIYSLSQKNQQFNTLDSYKSFMKDLKKTCIKRAKKPILEFKIPDLRSNNKPKQPSENEIEILSIIRTSKFLSKIFSAKHINEDFLSHIKFIKTKDIKKLDLSSNKTLDKLRKMISLFQEQGFEFKLEKISELFFLKSGKLYFNHEEPIENLIKKVKNASKESILDKFDHFVHKNTNNLISCFSYF